MALTLDSFIEQYSDRRKAVYSVLESRQPFLFIGAGVGADIYPMWSTLLGELLAAAGMTLTPQQSQLNAPQKAELIKDHDAATYQKVVRKFFQEWQPILERIIPVLTRLPVGGVITTNYDDALDENFEHLGFNSLNLKQIHPFRLKPDEHNVFHIHGLIKSNDPAESDLDIILSDDEYRQYYIDQPIISHFLQAALTQKDIIFLGFSMTDPYIVDVIKNIRAMEISLSKDEFPQQPVRRFALIETEIIERDGGRIVDWKFIESKEEELERLGITPIWFEKGSRYQGLFDLVSTWSKAFYVPQGGIKESLPGAP